VGRLRHVSPVLSGAHDPNSPTTTARPQSDAAYQRRLVWAYLAIWTFLALSPRYRADWALENVLVVAVAAALFVLGRAFTFSKTSSTLLFLFLCLHEVGAHYTYAEVPYDRWFEALTGTTLSALLGLQRNHFDRLVHFMFGFLLTVPVRETLLRTSAVRGLWSLVLPVAIVMAMSMSFELFEWWAAILFGGDLGVAYLGTQGDIWDGQKDMAMASLGSILAIACVAAGWTGSRTDRLTGDGPVPAERETSRNGHTASGE
jgi:putative membrane protein